MVLVRNAIIALIFLCAPSAVLSCEKTSVCEIDRLIEWNAHDWKLPVLEVLHYRRAFNDSEFSLAAFMLCNAPGRLSCLKADDELSARFGSEACKTLYFIALVDGQGSGGALMQRDFKVVYAMKRGEGIVPLNVSNPEEDVGPVDCHLQAVYSMRQ